MAINIKYKNKQKPGLTVSDFTDGHAYVLTDLPSVIYIANNVSIKGVTIYAMALDGSHILSSTNMTGDEKFLEVDLEIEVNPHVEE